MGQANCRRWAAIFLPTQSSTSRWPPPPPSSEWFISPCFGNMCSSPPLNPFNSPLTPLLFSTYQQLPSPSLYPLGSGDRGGSFYSSSSSSHRRNPYLERDGPLDTMAENYFSRHRITIYEDPRETIDPRAPPSARRRDGYNTYQHRQDHRDPVLEFRPSMERFFGYDNHDDRRRRFYWLAGIILCISSCIYSINERSFNKLLTLPLCWCSFRLSGTALEYWVEHQLTFQVNDSQWNKDKNRQSNGVDLAGERSISHISLLIYMKSVVELSHCSTLLVNNGNSTATDGCYWWSRTNGVN